MSNTPNNTCPICGHENPVLLMDTASFPVFQHPVDIVDKPLEGLEARLCYHGCSHCAHAWQPEFDQSMLETLYRSYYYTPNPGCMEDVFRDNFLSFLTTIPVVNSLIGSNPRILEIGCSGGDCLEMVANHLGSSDVVGYEPSRDTSAVARQRGFEIRDAFFSMSTVQKEQPFDLIYSRHVIEHVFDLEDHIAALGKVATEGTILLIETPCLDWSFEHDDIAPFSLEHIRLFSQQSLQGLLERECWKRVSVHVSDMGPMIQCFQRCDASPSTEVPRAEVVLDGRFGEGLNKTGDDLRAKCNGRRVLFWGAGAGCRKLIALSGVKPERLLDGNPSKSGKAFPGIDQRIEHADTVVQDHISRGIDSDCVLVISSTFHKEIGSRLRDLGWAGEVVAPFKVV